MERIGSKNQENRDSWPEEGIEGVIAGTERAKEVVIEIWRGIERNGNDPMIVSANCGSASGSGSGSWRSGNGWTENETGTVIGMEIDVYTSVYYCYPWTMQLSMVHYYDYSTLLPFDSHDFPITLDYPHYQRQ